MEQQKTTSVTQSGPWIPPLNRKRGKYVYHWNRILEAIAVLTIVAGLVGYGLYAWLSSPSSPADIDLSETQPEAIVAMEDPRRSEGRAPSTSMSDHTPQSTIPSEQETPVADRLQTRSQMPEAQSAQQPLVEPGVREEERALATAAHEKSLVQSTDGTEPSLEASGETRSTGGEQETPLVQSSGRAQPSLEVSTASQTPIEPSSTAEIEAREEPESELPETTPAPTVELTSAQPDPVQPIEDVSPAAPVEGDAATGPATALDAAIRGDRPEEQARVTESPKSGRGAESGEPAERLAEEGAQKSPLRSKDSQIVSPTVKRFLLAKSVSNNKPRGGLDDIQFNAHGVATVCSFSEVVDRSGDRLSYVWLRDGERVATVPVEVGADRWRSYSTKVINRSMKGAWRVELHDRDGTLLASADFRL